MKKFFGEKQHRFSLRKLAIGLVSASISSLFFVSIASSGTVFAQENAAVHYKYVTDTELSGQEKDLIVKDIPKIAEDSSHFCCIQKERQKESPLECDFGNGDEQWFGFFS